MEFIYENAANLQNFKRPPVRGVARGIDRLDLLIGPRTMVDRAAILMLRPHARRVGRPRRRRPRGGRGPYGGLPWVDRLPRRLAIYGPRPSIVPLLDAWLAEGVAMLTAGEFVLDLLADDELAARELLDWLAAHVRPRTRNSAVGTDSATLKYWGDSRRKRRPCVTLAVYADRLSKLVADAPCCHVEHRVRGATRLRLAGVVTPADAFRVAADPRWFDDRVRFFAVDLAKLGAAYAGRVRRVRPGDAALGQELLNASRGRLDQLIADMAAHDRSPSRRGRPKVGTRWLVRVRDPFANVPVLAPDGYISVQTSTNDHSASVKPKRNRSLSFETAKPREIKPSSVRRSERSERPATYRPRAAKRQTADR